MSTTLISTNATEFLNRVSEDEGIAIPEPISSYLVETVASATADELPSLAEDVGLYICDAGIREDNESAVKLANELIEACGLRTALLGDSADAADDSTLLASPVTISSRSEDAAAAAASNTQSKPPPSKYAVRLKGETEGSSMTMAEFNAAEKEVSGEPTQSLEDFIADTHAEDARARLLALRELCPCHVKDDIDEFWARIVEMTQDPDPAVRYQALHNLCDGSPRYREVQVITAVEAMHDDEDKNIARKVRNILGHYRRTGDWNIM